MKIIPFIFARGGSKGIKNKNIYDVCGRPLIYYSINSALRSKYISEVFVSTDSVEIADIAKNYGATIPFMRPSELAQDDTPGYFPWKHVVETYKDYDDDTILLALYPVTPLRTTQNINDAVEYFITHKPDLIITGTESHRNPYFNMVEKVDESYKIILDNKSFYTRQNSPPTFDLTPSIYLSTFGYIRSCTSKFLDCNLQILVVSKEEGIDIDDKFDMNMAIKFLDDKTLDYLVCGLGSIGKQHLNNLQRITQKIGIVHLSNKKVPDSDTPNARNYKEFYGISASMNYYPKNAIICTPSNTHCEVALEYAKNFTNLLIEKPLDLSLSKAEELLRIVEKTHIKCLIGNTLRFDNGYKSLKSQLQNNQIGKPLICLIEVGYYLPYWRPDQDYRHSHTSSEEKSGGILYELIHELDYAVNLFGKVNSVYCQITRVGKLEINIHDSASLILEFECGVVCKLHFDYLNRVYSRNCKVIGEEGTIEWQLQDNKLILQTKESREEIPYQSQTSHERLLEELLFFNRIVNNQEAFDSVQCLQESIYLLKIIECALDSDRKQVKLLCEGL